ncbi:guanine nucleotide-binding protein-like 3 homolog [Fopius arisanus]|uniref:Guanine nucleotide-binding protein-like 3 homolog n=1 Tax=Fopius arisanus TaxID=64838 RepID=A0A9R1U984_9HYME|nr:PREDICTED: guanine nucleotide-binding protein-like 3 homolog [Fopius arisanus]
MAKFCLKKRSKRVEARQRYKIEKKVREHNRKKRKEAKKNPKKTSKMMIIPNQCPFKEEILQEVEAMKRQNELEKQQRRAAAQAAKKAKRSCANLDALVSSAESKGQAHLLQTDSTSPTFQPLREENSLKAYHKEFKKVLESADVILEVVDARDPLGTRCKQVEEAVRLAKGNKKLVIVLNKADLVPRVNLDEWLKYFRSSLPAVAFKASTQEQSKRIGRKKIGLKRENMIQSSICFGAELLLSLLGNYCRNAGDVKQSIQVGVVGLPNVGKSSIINSLKRSKACNIGSTPGITKTMQTVQLDSKIRLLDSPGIVFVDDSTGDDSSVALKNAVKIQSLKDPFTPASVILKRISKKQIMELYDMPDFQTPEEFFVKKAERMGMFKKGGVVDVTAAARSVLNDWNSGKIRYYTVPPELPSGQVSAAIITEDCKEFDIEKFTADEKMMLDDVTKEALKTTQVIDPLIISSTGPVEFAMEVEVKKKEFKLQKLDERENKKMVKIKSEPNSRKKKVIPLFHIEGNQKLNKLNKLEFKKQKKEKVKREKVAGKLADQLGEFSLTTEDNYNFDTHFQISEEVSM